MCKKQKIMSNCYKPNTSLQEKALIGCIEGIENRTGSLRALFAGVSIPLLTYWLICRMIDNGLF